MKSCQRLVGAIQHYAWGGYDFIPQLLGQDNSPQRPYAEYWLGVHPKGMAVLPAYANIDLASWLGQDPPGRLGDQLANELKELPFLLKVLDVRQMLSIQLHPTKEVAALGFEREEAAGIPRDAPNRNYRDRNHKPEVMVALTDFWLLHGFRDLDTIAATLATVPGWAPLRQILIAQGVAGLYRHVMELPQVEVNALLEPLRTDLSSRVDQLQRKDPDYWAWQAFQEYSAEGHHDRGIFSIYWFNLVHLLPGEGIFQGSGIPHAYLEGVNVELMANSDNVLRGGLTPKHIDVAELLANIHTEAITPQALRANSGEDGGQYLELPVADFALVRWQLASGSTFKLPELGPAIGLVMAGELHLAGVTYQRGAAFFLPPRLTVAGEAAGEAALDLFIAYVPVPRN